MQEESISGENMEAAAPLESGEMNAQAEQRQPERTVPLAALESERAHRQQKEEEARILKEHLALLQSNRNNPEPRVRDEFEGLQEDDLLTVKEVRKFAERVNSKVLSEINEIKVAQKYPDYSEVVTKYLPELLKSKPELIEPLKSTQNYELAYHLAKNSDNYRKDNQKVQISADAERIIKNSQQAGTLSSVGASTPVSGARRYRDMSDDDFKKEVARNMGFGY